MDGRPAPSRVPPAPSPLCTHSVLTLEVQPLAWSKPVRGEPPETDLTRGAWAPRAKGLPEVMATMGPVTTQVAFLSAVPPPGGSSLSQPPPPPLLSLPACKMG